MNYRMVINVAAMVAAITCLVRPSPVGAHGMMNRYGQQQLAQKQNRYSSPMWLNGINRATGWPVSSYGGGGSMMRHYPVSLNRYQAAASGNRHLLSDDYYDANIVNPYDPRSYDRLDYAVVRYPSYGLGGNTGYYSVADLYDGPSSDNDNDDGDDDDDDDDDLLYDDMAFGDRDPVPSVAAASSYYPVVAASTAADHRYTPPLQISSPLNRYEPTRYPTDKIHKFRKVFMSNPVSPSNAFKTPKERQLYNFWESLVNGDLESMQRTDYDDDGKQQRGQHSSLESETSQLYQHLPSIFQQLQKQQKQKQHQQQQQQGRRQEQQHPPQSAGEKTPVQSLSSSLSALSSLSSSLSSSPSAPSSAALSQFVPHGNLYKQWANGSPLIKRSSSGVDRVPPLITPSENDDVQQLEKLKTVNTAATTTTSESPATTTTMVSNVTANVTTVTTVALPMADGGQREYVLPRPAGEKSGFESLLEVMAEGGLRGHFDDKNSATAYNSQLHQESKVNKKRSFVSDETSLAAQLGALRKN